MLDNIRDHSLLVGRCAVTLCDALATNDIRLNRQLVLAGALLHDIAKTICLDGHCGHAEQGHAICLELGFDQVAEIVRQHVILDDFDAPLSAISLVYYADKRVRHAEIVSLLERRLYIEERYGQDDPVYISRIQENFIKCLQVEERIFAPLPFGPDELAIQVAAAED